MNDKTIGSLRFLFPSVEERREQAKKQHQLEAEQWQRMECEKYGLTVEQHNQILELAAKLQSVAPRGDGYSAVMAVMTPRTNLSKLGI